VAGLLVSALAGEAATAKAATSKAEGGVAATSLKGYKTSSSNLIDYLPTLKQRLSGASTGLQANEASGSTVVADSETLAAGEFETPKAYLDELDSRILKMKADLMSKTKPHPLGIVAYDKHGKPVSGIEYYMQRPSKQHPGHSDSVAIMLIPGQEMPFLMGGAIDATKGKNGLTSGTEFEMLHSETNNLTPGTSKYTGVVDPNVIDMFVSVNSTNNVMDYRIGIHPSQIPADNGTDSFDYSKHPAQVIKVFDRYFALAESFGLKTT